MLIIGCDYHPAFEQITFVDTATGDCGEQRLVHREEAEKFYRDLAAQGMKVGEFDSGPATVSVQQPIQRKNSRLRKKVC